ncbi:GGDEF domain-containing protein [bacterium c-19]|nr:GGDEF domain-containing protein [bacterium c-19]
MKKRKLSIHVKILLLLCTSIGLLGLDGFGVYQIDQMMQQRIIDTYAALQDEAAQRLSHHMREAFEQNKAADKNADAVFVAYIQEQKSSADTYWFLYRKDKILFERDAMQTAMQDGKDLNRLIEEWRNKGGNLQQANTLFGSEQAHGYITKEAGGALESISTTTMQINGTLYIIGSSATTASVLRNVGYQNVRLLLMIAGGILAALIIAFAVMLVHMLKKYQRMKMYKEEIQHTYRAELTRLNQELKERRRQAKDEQLMDPLGLFYNREYFYTLLLNMKRQNLKSIGMIVIELNSLHPYIDAYGLDFEQETLSQIKECLERCVLQECIIARVRENRIVITIISDDYRKMSEECNALDKALATLGLTISFKIYSIIQMPNESAMDMYQRIDQIISIQ